MDWRSEWLLRRRNKDNTYEDPILEHDTDDITGGITRDHTYYANMSSQGSVIRSACAEVGLARTSS